MDARLQENAKAQSFAFKKVNDGMHLGLIRGTVNICYMYISAYIYGMIVLGTS